MIDHIDGILTGELRIYVENHINRNPDAKKEFDQLKELITAIDNYVDIINNEWGQELGNVLKKKYNISSETYWTPILLANFLNDIQSYYSWAFHIGFKPFRAEDEMVIRFSDKINLVMNNVFFLM